MNTGYTTDTYAGGRNDQSATRDYYFATRMAPLLLFASTFTGGQLGVGTAMPQARLDVAGTMKFGNSGTPFTALIRRAVSLDVGTITQGTTRLETVSVPGASLGGTAMVSPANGRAALGGATIAFARVSAADVVEIGFSSHEAGGTNPGMQDYYITVIH